MSPNHRVLIFTQDCLSFCKQWISVFCLLRLVLCPVCTLSYRGCTSAYSMRSFFRFFFFLLNQKLRTRLKSPIDLFSWGFWRVWWNAKSFCDRRFHFNLDGGSTSWNWSLLDMFVSTFAFKTYCLVVMFYLSPFLGAALESLFVDFP